jgi:S-adenosylmethionine hydrolase
LPALRAETDERHIQAQIVHIDRFGNAITNLRREDFAKWLSLHGQRGWTAKIGDLRFNALCQTYAEVKAGEPLLLFNSYDLLEVAVNRGNAAEQLGIRKGDVLEIWAEGVGAE